MPTAAEIERIAALTERLTPLATRRRGELIEADHWNTLVEALLEIGRAVLSDEEREVPPHSHPDQVSGGWLEPSLRARLERGPLADPASVARVAKLERRLDGFRTSLDDVRIDIGSVRTAASRVETSDLDRRASITRLTRKVDGLGDARDDVSVLRSSLDVLRTDLDRVSTFARDLEVDGEAVSVASLVDRLAGLEGLRDRLTGPNGEELNATTLEVRLADLRESLVTEEDLDQAFEDLRDIGISDDLRAELTEASRFVAREEVTTVTSTLEEGLLADIATRITAAETRATAAAATRAEEITAGLRDELRSEISDEIAAGDSAVRATIDEAVSGSRAAMSEELDGRLGELVGSLGGRIDERFGALAPELTAGLEEAVTELRTRIDPLDARMVSFQRAVDRVAGETDSLRRDLAARTSELADSIRRETEAAMARTLAAAELADRQTFDSLRAQLASERLRVDRQLEQIQGRLPGLIEGQLSTARTEILRTIRTEMDGLETEIDTRIERNVNLRVTNEFERRNFRTGGGGLNPFDPIR